MKKYKEKTKENLSNNQTEEVKLYCEYFQEWKTLKDGCKNLREYCPYRNQCLIYFYSTVKEV
ncbi:MAG: hypothetical protein NZ530_01435 [Thermodesulfobacteriaceae bacterium]|nr:hypothetical protein [Thermodesulfobacteriaceae bacterium]MCX8041188.1 hypothetical protein [Thermodesulfobacteriaceae bacterium]MDW8135174.1 hypothetical protein [Thermodesulfobacterium sp.]